MIILMKAKHHFWSSLAAGGALYWASGSGAALAGAMLGGFFIDADHVIDHWLAVRHGAPYTRKTRGPSPSSESGLRAWAARYLRRRKLVRLPLIFHSYELLIALAVLTVMIRAPFLTGLCAGYALHLALDLYRHYHEFRSPFFYLLSYRLAQGFRRDKLIKPEYL